MKSYFNTCVKTYHRTCITLERIRLDPLFNLKLFQLFKKKEIKNKNFSNRTIDSNFSPF